MKFYIGVNSDNTAIIATVPIARFHDKEDADKKKMPCSYSDTQLPPHWIVDHTEDAKDPHAPKLGWVDIGNYLKCNKALADLIVGKSLTWDGDAIEIELEDNFIEIKSDNTNIVDIEDIKELLNEYDRKRNCSSSDCYLS